MAVTQDGQDATPIYSGDPRVWGAMSDLIIVKEMNIAPVPDEVMAFTPDGLPSVPGPPKITGTGLGPMLQAERATLNLDKAYVTQTYWRPERPQPFTRETEYNRSVVDDPGDPGMNPAEMGAIGKLTDVFRVSIANNYPFPDSPKAEAAAAALKLAFPDEKINDSYNDYFGSGIGKPDVFFGRLEFRISAHFYYKNSRSGPLYFTNIKWPIDGDPPSDSTPGTLAERPVLIDAKITEQSKIKLPGGAFLKDPVTGKDLIGMAGEILTGGIAFTTSFHGWGMLVGIPRTEDCSIGNADLNKETAKVPGAPEERLGKFTIDDRVTLFSVPKCPAVDAGFETECETSALTAYLSCEEVAVQKYQQRWITIVDRFNSLLNEIDRLFCIAKGLDFNSDKIVADLKLKDTVFKSLLATLKAESIVSTVAIDKMIADSAAIVELDKIVVVCKEAP